MLIYITTHDESHFTVKKYIDGVESEELVEVVPNRTFLELRLDTEALRVVPCRGVNGWTFALDQAPEANFPAWDYTYLSNEHGQMCLAFDVDPEMKIGVNRSPQKRVPKGYTVQQSISALQEALVASEMVGGNTDGLRDVLMAFLNEQTKLSQMF